MEEEGNFCRVNHTPQRMSSVAENSGIQVLACDVEQLQPSDYSQFFLLLSIFFFFWPVVDLGSSSAPLPPKRFCSRDMIEKYSESF